MATIQDQDKAEVLLRRYRAVAHTVQLFHAKLRVHHDENLRGERVESELELAEQQWEHQLDLKRQLLAGLEAELVGLQDENKHLTLNGGGGGSGRGGLEADHASLKELLALRMEEKKDMEAALHSLRATKQTASPHRGQSTKHDAELDQLQRRKETLAEEIVALEDAQEEEQQQQTPELQQHRASLAQAQSALATAQAQMARHKRAGAMLEDQMKRMIAHQLQQQDTSGSNSASLPIKEEAVILDLLFQHAGEMAMSDLKQATAAALAARGQESGNPTVIRALYSLVANNLVQIDRSHGNGIVTSLIV